MSHPTPPAAPAAATTTATTAGAAPDVSDYATLSALLHGRYSCRAFLPEALSQSDLRQSR